MKPSENSNTSYQSNIVKTSQRWIMDKLFGGAKVIKIVIKKDEEGGRYFEIHSCMHVPNI